jgi:hypothetical protein
VFVVAITRLGALPKFDASLVEREAATLAGDLGTSAYEIRLALSAGTPAIVLTTPDADRVREVAGKIRARGHGVVACDTADVVPSSAMRVMRRFSFGELALTLDDDAAAKLPWGGIVGMFRATHRRSATPQSDAREATDALGTRSAPGLLGGRAGRPSSDLPEMREQVLYLFPRDGNVPWILRETGTRYEALGAARQPSTLANFLATVAELRARAPRAVYDERLLGMKKTPERVAAVIAKSAHTNAAEAGTDLLAHLLAISLG